MALALALAQVLLELAACPVAEEEEIRLDAQQAASEARELDARAAYLHHQHVLVEVIVEGQVLRGEALDARTHHVRK